MADRRDARRARFTFLHSKKSKYKLSLNKITLLKNLLLFKELVMSKKHLGCQKCNTPTQNGAPGKSRIHSEENKLAKKMSRAFRRPAGLRTARHFDPGRHLHGVESSKDRHIVESSSLVLMSSPLCRLALVPPPLRRLELAPSALWRLGPVPSSPDPALL